MTPAALTWTPRVRSLVVASTRTLRRVLERLHRSRAEWVVIVRAPAWTPEVFYYAYRARELEEIAARSPGRAAQSLEIALDLHETGASQTSLNRQATAGGAGAVDGPAARVVDLDAFGSIVAIGAAQPEQPAAAPPPAAPPPPAAAPSAPAPTAPAPVPPAAPRGGWFRWRRSRARPEAATAEPPLASAAPGPTFEAVASAETKSEIRTGTVEVVDFRIELARGASPLAASRSIAVERDKPIMVALSVERTDIVEIVRDAQRIVSAPAPEAPVAGYFLIKGIRDGATRLAVMFHQGGRELAAITLAVTVAPEVRRTTPAAAAVSTATEAPPAVEPLVLLIEERREGAQAYYEYRLYSESLGFNYMTLRSRPLLDRGGGPAATTLAYVGRIYQRVTQELRSWDDVRALGREVRALGVNLCDELFEPEVVNALWPLRDRLEAVHVASWEPYIPWELLRLRNMKTGEIDDRFLAEYGLVRTLPGEMLPRALPMRDWRYLSAEFPMGTYPAVAADLSLFERTLPAKGVTVTRVDGSADALYDTLAEADYDVLHLACHAEAPHEAIESARLIIGDTTPPGASTAQAIAVDSVTLAAEAQLRPRRPLVFLSACETGRAGAVLTAWGGWPNVFIRAGAGAFVGAAWAVRDRAAASFGEAFYSAMLDGVTLTEAATRARQATKELGDASWLAFKVYGHPRARRAAT